MLAGAQCGGLGVFEIASASSCVYNGENAQGNSKRLVGADYLLGKNLP
jgi:hypothetical protein